MQIAQPKKTIYEKHKRKLRKQKKIYKKHKRKLRKQKSQVKRNSNFAIAQFAKFAH